MTLISACIILSSTSTLVLIFPFGRPSFPSSRTSNSPSHTLPPSLPPSLPSLPTSSPGVQVRQAAVGHPPSCPEEARGDQGLLWQAPCSSGRPLNFQQQQQQGTHRHHRLSASLLDGWEWKEERGLSSLVLLWLREGGRGGGEGVCKKEGSWAFLGRGEEGEKK